MKARPDGKAVQQMFAEIAPRYDFLNHFLSISIDRLWRKVAVATAAASLEGKSNPICLDLCSGTGDLAIELNRALNVPVVASDFCHPMLTRGLEKVRQVQRDGSIPVIEADSLVLPFADQSFDVASIAFGLRNLEDTKEGLAEMKRVLKPGGTAIVLEFSRPVIPVFRQLFEFYFHHILPHLGALISGQNSAYRYLPTSVSRFPPQKELASMMESIGYKDVGYRNLSGGIAALHWGTK
jgi:demethylmenaquinone methyltransferase / 2-methoxy-6-polyprenyl-1,4-benzoquinol methylase